MRSLKTPSRSEATNKTKVLPDTKIIRTERDRATKELADNKSKADALDVVALKIKNRVTGGVRAQRETDLKKIPASTGNSTTRRAPKPEGSQVPLSKSISKRDTMRMHIQGMGMQGMGMMRMGMMKREAENLKPSNVSQITKGGLKETHNVTRRDTMRMGMQGMGMQGMGMMRMGSRMMKREAEDIKPSNDSQIFKKGDLKAAHNVTTRDTMRMGMQGMGMMRMGNRMMKREAENQKTSNVSQVKIKGGLKGAHNVPKRDTMRMGMQGMGMMRMGSQMMKREAEKPKLPVNSKASPSQNKTNGHQEDPKPVSRPTRHHSAMHAPVETPKRNLTSSSNKPAVRDEEALTKPKRNSQSTDDATKTPTVTKDKSTHSSVAVTRPKRSSGSGGGYGGNAPARSSSSAPSRSSSYNAPARSSSSAPSRSSSYNAPARASSYGGSASRSASGYSG